MEWTTPMGLPVVQPYRAKGKKVIRTLVQSFVVQFENDENKVQKNKQRSAFPPNFIHSIDSAHMMKTAVACHEAMTAGLPSEPKTGTNRLYRKTDSTENWAHLSRTKQRVVPFTNEGLCPSTEDSDCRRIWIPMTPCYT